MRRMLRGLSAMVLTTASGLAAAQTPAANPAGQAPLIPPVAPASASTSAPAGVAAIVNGQPILEKAVYRALRQFPPEHQNLARKEILAHLIENVLIDQYLTAIKVTVDPKEVDKVIQELKDELAAAKKDYKKELEAMLLTEEEFRAEVMAQMKWEKFVLQQGTDEALKKLFDSNPEVFDGTLVRARHILINPGADEAINRAFCTALIDLQYNPFYQAHQASLLPVMELAILNWQNANQHEVSYIKRSVLTDIMVFVAALVGGRSHALAIGPEIEAAVFRDDDFEAYRREVMGPKFHVTVKE